MRSRLRVALAILTLAASSLPASGQSAAYCPSLVIRSLDQFVTLSADDTAVRCSREGRRISTFVAPGPIVRLEASEDETVIRLQLSDAQEVYFQVRTGLPVSKDQFTTTGPPRQCKFRMNARADTSFVGGLEVFEVESGRSVQRMEEVRYVSRARWSQTGTAEVAVGMQRAGRTGLSAFRFDPDTGELRELFWFPGYFDSVDYFAFDADRGYGVVTSRNFETSVIDLRTGKNPLHIDQRISPPAPPPVWVSTPGWLTPGTALVAVAGAFGFVVFSVVGARAAWRVIQRRVVAAGGNSPEAQDYREPFGT
jgi:hypothetical protein